MQVPDPDRTEYRKLKRNRGPVCAKELFEKLIDAGGVPPLEEEHSPQKKRKLYSEMDDVAPLVTKGAKKHAGPENNWMIDDVAMTGTTETSETTVVNASEALLTTGPTPGSSSGAPDPKRKGTDRTVKVRNALSKLSGILGDDTKLVQACKMMVKLLSSAKCIQTAEDLYIKCLFVSTRHLKGTLKDWIQEDNCSRLDSLSANRSERDDMGVISPPIVTAIGEMLTAAMKQHTCFSDVNVFCIASWYLRLLIYKLKVSDNCDDDFQSHCVEAATVMRSCRHKDRGEARRSKDGSKDLLMTEGPPHQYRTAMLDTLEVAYNKVVSHTFCLFPFIRLTHPASFSLVCFSVGVLTLTLTLT